MYRSQGKVHRPKIRQKANKKPPVTLIKGGWAKLRQELRLLEKIMREQEELIDMLI